MKSELKLIEVASELGAGTRGASLGPEAIRRACIEFEHHPLFDLPNIKVETRNELLHQTNKYPNAIRLEGICNMWERISEHVKHCLMAQHMPLIIAGDHSNAGGTLAGLRSAYPKDRIGVVWIDAHADVHSPYTTPSGNVHGMPLSAILGDDNKECQRNKPSNETVEYWERMKSMAEVCPIINPEDLYFLGIRDLEKEEIEYLKRLNIASNTVEEVRTLGANQTIQNVLEYLGDIDHLYISFDVDSLDPSISIGTGTPVENGFTENEALDLVLNFIKAKTFRCLEITEVNPLLDNENKMAKLVASYLTSIIPAMQEQLELKHA